MLRTGSVIALALLPAMLAGLSLLLACGGNNSIEFIVNDRDCDGIEDGLDATFDDSDGDLIGDICDNCPSVSNFAQLDTDGDDDGNACDNDDDNDGDIDTLDNCPLVPNANQDSADGDSDGVPNACDNCISISNNTQVDTDADGRGNPCDNCVSVRNINGGPTDCNHDGDTTDAGEAALGQCDSDGDGVGDACNPS